MITDPQRLHPLECQCLHWKPIVAGALTAIGLSFLLNLFSVAIGLTAYTTDSQGIENLALGGLVATALGIVVSMFAAGWLAGYLGNRYCQKRHLGALYGFLAWCLALIVTILLAENVQHYITFYTHYISGTTTGSVTANGGSIKASFTGVQTGKVVLSTYILFCLFFLSAFACSFGGHCGMRYIDKENP